MKKSVIGMLLLGAFGAAHAQSSVEIYGVVTGGLSYTDQVTTTGRGTGNRVALDSGQYTQSRIGFRGVEDLGGGLKADFVIEGGFTMDNGASTQSSTTFGRRTTVGLTGGLGDIEMGRRKDYTDFIASQYSTASRMLPFTGKAHGNNLDRSTGERSNNMLYYTTPNFGGFQANASYGFGEAAGSNISGQSLGLGANYDNGPFGIGFAFWQSRKPGTVTTTTTTGGVTTTTATNNSSDQGATNNAGCNTAALGNVGDVCTRVYMLGSNLDIGPVTLRGTYSLVKQPLVNASSGTAPAFTTTFAATAGTAAFTAGGINNSRADIYDIGADYKLGSWLLKGSVIYSRYQFVGANTSGKLTTLVLGADYNLSKRTLVYAMLANMRATSMYSPGLTSNGAPGVDNSQNALALGMLHRF